MNRTACAVFVAAIAGLGAGFVGCQSSKERAEDSAMGGLEFFQEDLAKAPAQIDKTVKALEAATTGGIADRKSAVSSFSKELKVLNKQADSLTHSRDNAEAHTQEYFRQWLKETRTFKTKAERDEAIRAYEAGKSNETQALEYLRLGARNFRELSDKLNGAEASLKADSSDADAAKVGQTLGPIHDNAIKVKAYIERLNDSITAALTKK